MIAPKHTPGPWRVVPGTIRDISSRIHTADNSDWIAQTFAGLAHRANAERIVACVNACEGIADPAAVPEMLAALTECLALITNPDAEAHDADRVEKLIRATIARAEGKV